MCAATGPALCNRRQALTAPHLPTKLLLLAIFSSPQLQIHRRKKSFDQKSSIKSVHRIRKHRLWFFLTNTTNLGSLISSTRCSFSVTHHFCHPHRRLLISSFWANPTNQKHPSWSPPMKSANHCVPAAAITVWRTWKRATKGTVLIAVVIVRIVIWSPNDNVWWPSRSPCEGHKSRTSST